MSSLYLQSPFPFKGIRGIAFISALASVIAGLLAALQMEHQGHVITGMNNQIVWGLPHVFAIFLIVSASGALNVASIASVFKKDAYKPLSRVSIALAISLLIAGLTVILLDLGRPDRLIVAMTYYNFASIFTWNIFLYTGFIAIAVVYLWSQLDWEVNKYSTKIGKFAFAWRLILTAGTGSIFGVLIARDTYHIALMAPMFILLSLGFGLSWQIVLSTLLDSNKTLEPFQPLLSSLLRKLLIVSALCSAIFLVFNMMDTRTAAIFSDPLFGSLFWIGYCLLGLVIPYILLSKNSGSSLLIASMLTIVGGFALIFVIVVAGQALPLQIADGFELITADSAPLASYTASFWEWLLGFGGIGLAMFLFLLQSRLFRLVKH